MAVPKQPGPTVFFVAALAADQSHLARAETVLEREFGPAWATLPPRPFTYSDYYRDEVGDAPLRAFYGFETTFHPGCLAARKLLSNRLEEELAAGSGYARPVNLDPGYLAVEKVVLASAKNFAHRIYLADGIYGEVTLQYYDKRFQTLKWTFPDYASGEYFPFFLELRRRLLRERPKTEGY